MIKTLIFILAMMFSVISCNKTDKKELKNSSVKVQSNETTKKEVTKKKVSHKLDAKLIKDEFYEVEFDFKDEINSTDEFVLKITAIPKKDRHINDGFPASLKFEDSCFKFEKKKFKGKDAKTFNEKTLVFEIKSKCETKGKQKLKGNLKFGYCTDELCYTYNSPFLFNINIK